MGFFNTAFKFPDHSINVAFKLCYFKATENEGCADIWSKKSFCCGTSFKLHPRIEEGKSDGKIKIVRFKIKIYNVYFKTGKVRPLVLVKLSQYFIANPRCVNGRLKVRPNLTIISVDHFKGYVTEKYVKTAHH